MGLFTIRKLTRNEPLVVGASDGRRFVGFLFSVLGVLIILLGNAFLLPAVLTANLHFSFLNVFGLLAFVTVVFNFVFSARMLLRIVSGFKRGV